MSATETIWLDEKPLEPFDGVLVVMNIGEENYEDIWQRDRDYATKVEEAVRSAHAKGWLVLFLFDDDWGVMPAPQAFDILEDQDFVRPTKMICKDLRDLNFSGDPNTRMHQFGDILCGIVAHKYWKFRKLKAQIMGLCTIEGVDVQHPLMEIVGSV
jgi:hypothetical protein